MDTSHNQNVLENVYSYIATIISIISRHYKELVREILYRPASSIIPKFSMSTNVAGGGLLWYISRHAK